MTEEVEIDFFKTLALLKEDNPVIYDKDKTFFKEHVAGEEAAAAKPKKKEKPVFLKDHERQRLLTKGAEAFVSDDEEEQDQGV